MFSIIVEATLPAGLQHTSPWASSATLVRLFQYAEIPIPTSTAQGAFSVSFINPGEDGYSNAKADRELIKINVTWGRISALSSVPAQIKLSELQKVERFHLWQDGFAANAEPYGSFINPDATQAPACLLPQASCCAKDMKYHEIICKSRMDPKKDRRDLFAEFPAGRVGADLLAAFERRLQEIVPAE